MILRQYSQGKSQIQCSKRSPVLADALFVALLSAVVFEQVYPLLFHSPRAVVKRCAGIDASAAGHHMSIRVSAVSL